MKYGIVAVIGVVPVVSATTASATEQIAKPVHGVAFKGRLSGAAPDSLTFTSVDGARSVRLNELKRIDFDAPVLPAVSHGPIRRFRLTDGGSFTGGLLDLTSERMTFAPMWSSRPTTVLRSAVSAVETPAGERDVVYENFERAPTVWTVNSGRLHLHGGRRVSGASALHLMQTPFLARYEFDQPLRAGRISFNFYDDEESEPHTSPTRKQGTRLRVPMLREAIFVENRPHQPDALARAVAVQPPPSLARFEVARSRVPSGTCIVTRRVSEDERPYNVRPRLRVGLPSMLRIVLGATSKPVRRAGVGDAARTGRRPESKSPNWGFTLVLASGKRRRHVTIQLGGRNVHTAFIKGELAINVHPLARRAGWRRLTASLEGGRLLVLIDNHVLASADNVDAKIVAVKLFADQPQSREGEQEKGAGTLEPSAWIDDFIATRYVDRPRSRPPSARGDVLEFHTGDALFGQVASANSRRVRMQVHGRDEALTVPWADARRLSLASIAATPEPVEGWIVRLDLRTPLDLRRPDDGVLVVAVQHVVDDVLVCRHPWLGLLQIPFERLRRITPRYQGRLRLLTPAIVHLGDEVRPSFQRPAPAGRRVEGRFEIERLPGGRIFFAVDAGELEPSGPRTPPGSPFLKDLRDGWLTTTLFVNNGRVGVLNEQLVWKASVENPERIRIPIAPDVLKGGANTWRLEQRPSRTDAKNFDDCELSRFALEVEAAR